MYYAIKMFKVTMHDEEVYKIAMREMRMLKQLRHYNIIHLIEAIKKDGRLYLIFEYIDKTLLQFIKGYPSGIPWIVAKKLMYQLCNAIKFCHSKEVNIK